MFSRPESARISDAYVAVRFLAGRDLTPEGKAFLERHDIEQFPTMMAMTRDGSVVDADLLGGRILDVDEILERLEEAAEAERAFAEERRAALDTGDAESLAELAEALEERGQPERAAALLLQAVEEGAGREVLERLAVLEQELGDAEGERQALDRLLEAYPEDPEAAAWRVRRAIAHLPADAPAEEAEALAAKHLAALDALRAEREAAGDAVTAAHARFRMAELLTSGQREAEADAHLAWIVEHAPGSRPGLVTLVLLARRALRQADVEQAATYARKVLEVGPTSPQAVDAHVLLGDLAYADGDTQGYLDHLREIVRKFPGTVAAERAAETIPLIEEELAGN